MREFETLINEATGEGFKIKHDFSITKKKNKYLILKFGICYLL